MTDAILKETGVVETPKRRGRPPKPASPTLTQDDMALLVSELRSLKARNNELEQAIIRTTQPSDTMLPNQYELERVLEGFIGKPEMYVIRQQGHLDRILTRYQPLLEAALQWEAQNPCPYCHARPGYNPLTGIWVRFWDAAQHMWVDGHVASCRTLMVDPRSVMAR